MATHIYAAVQKVKVVLAGRLTGASGRVSKVTKGNTNTGCRPIDTSSIGSRAAAEAASVALGGIDDVKEPVARGLS